MSYLLLEGFDAYDTTANYLALSNVNLISDQGFTYAFAPGRFEGQSLQVASPGGLSSGDQVLSLSLNSPIPLEGARFAQGMSLFIDEAVGEERVVFLQLGYPAPLLHLTIENGAFGYRFTEVSNQPLNGVRSTGLFLPVGNWFHLEVDLAVADDDVDLRVYVNGGLFYEELGIATDWNAVTNTSAIGLGGIHFEGKFDDVFSRYDPSWTAATPADTVRTGDSYIRTFIPTSDVTVTGITSSAGNPDNFWDQVDDLGTEYLITSTQATQTTFASTDTFITPPRDIYAVGVTAVARKIGSATTRADSVFGSTSYAGSVIGSVFQFSQVTLEQDPSTALAWEAIDVEALDFGFEYNEL